ncbi:MAG: isochorismatase family protein [Advenella sp.]
MANNNESAVYATQGFGAEIQLKAPFGLLIVDLVNGFADPAVFGGGNIREAIDNTVPLLAAVRRAGWPIAHTRIVYADDSSDHNVFSAKIPSMLTLTEQAPASQIVSELAPRQGELVVRKNVASAFFGTSLAAWLTHRGVHTLLVAGAVTSGCIRASVVDASQLGFVPLVIEDCVGDRAQGPHQANLFDMQQKYATVMKRDQALAALGIAAP